MDWLGMAVATAFAVVAMLHLYWALGGTAGIDKIVPTLGGLPVFAPYAWLMTTVALLALVLAGLALFLGLFAAESLFRPYAAILGCTVGGLLCLRAMGEFRYVGFFKRVRDSSYAGWDTWLYSPFYLVAGIAFVTLSANRI